jgi:hypothetical protein
MGTYQFLHIGVGSGSTPIYWEAFPERLKTLQNCKVARVTFARSFRLVIALRRTSSSNYSTVPAQLSYGKEIIMYDPIHAVVEEMQGNIGFLEKILSKPILLLSTVGIVGILTIVVFFLK